MRGRPVMHSAVLTFYGLKSLPNETYIDSKVLHVSEDPRCVFYARISQLARFFGPHGYRCLLFVGRLHASNHISSVAVIHHQYRSAIPAYTLVGPFSRISEINSSHRAHTGRRGLRRSISQGVGEMLNVTLIWHCWLWSVYVFSSPACVCSVYELISEILENGPTNV